MVDRRRLLYGIRSQYRLQLVEHGYKVLVATPYGPAWFFYLLFLSRSDLYRWPTKWSRLRLHLIVG